MEGCDLDDTASLTYVLVDPVLLLSSESCTISCNIRLVLSSAWLRDRGLGIIVVKDPENNLGEGERDPSLPTDVSGGAANDTLRIFKIVAAILENPAYRPSNPLSARKNINNFEKLKKYYNPASVDSYHYENLLIDNNEARKYDLQLDALKKAGCDKIFLEVASGTKANRPEWTKLLSEIKADDTLVVWKLDRMGRSLQHLVKTVNDCQLTFAAALLPPSQEITVYSGSNTLLSATVLWGNLTPVALTILSQEEEVTEITFLKTIQDPEIAAYKQSIVDVLCKDKQGTQFIVEMQISKHKGFEKRAQFYAAKAYSQQIIKEDEEHKKMAVYAKLRGVIFLAIADFIMFPEKKDWKSSHRLLDTKTYDNDLKDFHFIFIELTKFNKTIKELENIQAKWAYFFKHAHESTLEEMEHLIGKDIIIKKAFQAIDQASWSEEELRTYDKLVKTELDNLAVEQQKIEDAQARGKAEGMQIGEAKGMQIGEAKGVQIGEAKGMQIGEAKGMQIGETKKAISMAQEISIRKIKELGGNNMQEVISIQNMAAIYGKTTAEIEAAIEELIHHGFMKKLVATNGTISIRALRFRYKCSRAQLARMINISITDLEEYETATKPIPIQTLKLIAKVLIGDKIVPELL
ncbi:Serine recombinase PinE [Pseudolycoriella hygida]|uniref:Serine recombinase PinE n=1 Tax=Pseudolycoriella hygida TaxID=35572 RepID=A0A9Q0N7V3_9DIPT|nr:Serine recombinase PinE [Pseudolycoriella hygida]